MSAVVIVGAQWGDEGKGKIVDIYMESAEVVVRYAGGPNAGHTLVVGDEKLIVRLLPSGILRPGTKCVMGQGMVVDPKVLVGEIDELKRQLGQPSLQVDAGTGDSLEARFNRTQHELEAKTVQMKEKEKLLAERDAELAELRLVTERVTAARGGAALEEDRACCNLF